MNDQNFQSAFHDGKNPNWFHWNCFFDKHRLKSVGDIAHFEQIRYEDQKKVEDKISNKNKYLHNLIIIII